MKTFVLILVFAVLAAAAIRVWLVNTDEVTQSAKTGVATKQVDQDKELESSTVEQRGMNGAIANVPAIESDADENDVMTQEVEEIPLVFMSDFAELRDVIVFLGMDPEQFMAHAGAWYRERGLRWGQPGFGTGSEPVQPYEQYDEETLMSFAESGDTTAQEILAQRWFGTRPTESLAMATRAAEQGSVMAMLQISGFYQLTSDPDMIEHQISGDALTQVRTILDATPNVEIESARWRGAAQIISGGMIRGPDTGYFTDDTQKNLEMSAERQREICDLALQTYQDTLAARAAAGKPPIRITAPPVIYEPQVSGYCESPDWPRPDTSHCKMLRFAYSGRRATQTTQLFGLCPPKT